MRNVIAVVILLTGLLASGVAHARGGQAADDCPPGSTDPDCKGASSSDAAKGK
jgi:hypothetical protein